MKGKELSFRSFRSRFNALGLLQMMNRIRRRQTVALLFMMDPAQAAGRFTTCQSFTQGCTNPGSHVAGVLFFYTGAGYFWIVNVGFASYNHSVAKNFEVAVKMFGFTCQVLVNTNYVTRNRSSYP